MFICGIILACILFYLGMFFASLWFEKSLHPIYQTNSMDAPVKWALFWFFNIPVYFYLNSKLYTSRNIGPRRVDYFAFVFHTFSSFVMIFLAAPVLILLGFPWYSVVVYGIVTSILSFTNPVPKEVAP